MKFADLVNESNIKAKQLEVGMRVTFNPLGRNGIAYGTIKKISDSSYTLGDLTNKKSDKPKSDKTVLVAISKLQTIVQ